MDRDGVMDRISSPQIAAYLSPATQILYISDAELLCYLLRWIKDFPAYNPKHRIGSITGNNVTPMLLQLVYAHLFKFLVPCTDDNRRDLRIHQMLHSTVSIIEKLGIDLLELRIPSAASLIAVPRVRRRLLFSRHQSGHDLHHRESLRLPVSCQLLKSFPTQPGG